MSNHPLAKPTWQDRCVKVYQYHIGKVKLDRSWTIRQTATELNRSVGCISEDLQLAEFLRAHPTLNEIKHISDALAWVKDYKEKYTDRRMYR